MQKKWLKTLKDILVILYLNKNLTIFLISETIKPEQNIFKMIVKKREVTVIAKMPLGDERGIKLKSDPTIVSPNNPPIPKLCAHAFIGTSDAAYTEDNAIAMGTNISLPKALSDPICKRKRKPQINKIGANDQEPQPMTSIKGDAIAAPVLPSKF